MENIGKSILDRLFADFNKAVYILFFLAYWIYFFIITYNPNYNVLGLYLIIPLGIPINLIVLFMFCDCEHKKYIQWYAYKQNLNKLHQFVFTLIKNPEVQPKLASIMEMGNLNYDNQKKIDNSNIENVFFVRQLGLQTYPLTYLEERYDFVTQSSYIWIDPEFIKAYKKATKNINR